MPGCSGVNCTERCNYPAYGLRCKGYCDCEEDACDMSIGCRTPLTGKSHLPTPPPPPAKRNENDMQYYKRDVY